MRYGTLREDPVLQAICEPRGNSRTIPIAQKRGFETTLYRLTGKTSSENGGPESTGERLGSN